MIIHASNLASSPRFQGAVHTAIRASNATPPPDGQLVLNAQGPAVAELQTLLQTAGFYAGPADGNFDPATEAAVRDFQLAFGLQVDGWAGAQTIDALRLVAAGERVPGSEYTTPAPGVSPVLTGTSEERIGAVIGYANYWSEACRENPESVVYVGGSSPFREGGIGDGRTDQFDRQKPYLASTGAVCFDCSGFVIASYRQGGIDLEAMGYTGSSRYVANDGNPPLQDLGDIASPDQLRPGDIVAWNYTDEAGNHHGHVAMYVGDADGDGDGDFIESTPFGPANADGSRPGVQTVDAGEYFSSRIPAEAVFRRVPM